MIMPIDIDKKEFSRDKKGYNSREVDEFLDIIVADYEKVLNDNRQMAHKIKSLEAQLAEAQKDDGAMVETLETAKKLMADISASAERRAELMMRDAELEAENMLSDAKVSVKKLEDEHVQLSNKVRRLRSNFRRMLENELQKLDEDEFEVIKELDNASEDDDAIDEPIGKHSSPTRVIDRKEIEAATLAAGAGTSAKTLTSASAGSSVSGEIKTFEEELEEPVGDLKQATLSDLSEGLKKMAEEPASINDTIILK